MLSCLWSVGRRDSSNNLHQTHHLLILVWVSKLRIPPKTPFIAHHFTNPYQPIKREFSWFFSFSRKSTT